jgi:uncharacterized protein YlzI (FlbEa/FlbD family)
MTDITIVSGVQYTIDPDAIEMITDQDEHGAPGTYLNGITKGVLEIPDTVEVFLTKISTKFVKLTRVNGSAVWINVDAVSALGPAADLSPAARAKVWVGSSAEPVKETVAAAKTAINAKRKTPL